MAQPVWVLSVDLQTKTATFQSGLADAAKSARGAFTDIKSGASEMGGHVNVNMFAARHSVMALSEAFGGQLPRAITAFVAHLGPVGPALEAAFPFAAIGLGAVLLIEHLAKLQAEGWKLTEDQVRFGTAVQTAYNALDQKMLQAEIRADELRNDHLGALHHQLQLINAQSMEQLIQAFSAVAKEADVVFEDLQAHWYTVGIGSAGAKHALEDFQTKYKSLLAQGKDGEASDLLRGTRESAEKILQAQAMAKATPDHTQLGRDDNDAVGAHVKAMLVLQQAGVGLTDKEVEAQKTLVQALQAQVNIEEKVAALKKLEGSNATTQTGKEMSALRAEAARTAAEHAQKMGEITVQMEREQAQESAAVHESSNNERLMSDIRLANDEYRVHLEGNRALINALDKSGKDYNNQLRGLQDKAAELWAEHVATVGGILAKGRTAQYREDLQNLEQSEREQIEATEQGSAGRLAAIDAAIKAEQARGLQGTSFYRELLNQRVQTARETAAEEAKLAAEAGKESADNEAKTGELILAAERQRLALRDSARRMSRQATIDGEVAAANDEFALKQRALLQEAAALDKSGKDYENKLRAIQNKERQLVQAHENEITAIKDKAMMERNATILSAEAHFQDTLAAGLTQALMGHKSFASMMNSIGNEIVSGMIQNAIKSILANDMTKESDAAAAARKAFNAGMHFPFPANIVMAPTLGAAAFASVMAFQEGGVVPGVGRGDVVPAMLEPGEGIVNNSAMAKLNRGELGGNVTHLHAHVSPTFHLQALDTAGMEKLLVKHNDTISKHVAGEMRKLNR